MNDVASTPNSSLIGLVADARDTVSGDALVAQGTAVDVLLDCLNMVPSVSDTVRDAVDAEVRSALAAFSHRSMAPSHELVEALDRIEVALQLDDAVGEINTEPEPV